LRITPRDSQLRVLFLHFSTVWGFWRPNFGILSKLLQQIDKKHKQRPHIFNNSKLGLLIADDDIN